MIENIRGKLVGNTKAFVSTVIGLVAVVVLILGSVKFVPVNSVGVKFNNFTGSIQEEPVSSGLKFKIPFVEKITYVSTELRSADIDDVNVTTKDAQGALIDIELQYHVMPENATETFKQFRSTPEEEWINKFVYQRIQRGVQEAASKYSVSELRGDKRDAFQVEVDNTVKEALESNNLTLQSASVDDIEVSDTILNSIEENAKAKQDVETARQEHIKQEVQNETQVEKSESEAKVKRIESEAEAEANKNISGSITQEMIDYLEAQARQKHGWYKYNNMDPQIVEEGE